jgi:hypothetical protein
MKKYALLGVFFVAMVMVFLNVGNKTSYASNTVLSDDFSNKNSGTWKILGDADYTTNSTNNNLMLTPSKPNQVGTIWFNQPTQLSQQIKPPYTVTFKFKISDPSNQGADGIVFMFNKLKNTSPVAGGGMGFETGNGYGVEFDTYSNPYDPREDHISLFKNNPDHSKEQYLAQIVDTTFEDAQWHNVKINVSKDNVKVYLDNVNKINQTLTLDPTYSGFGFTASTGAYYNTQSIDDVVITKPATVTGVSSTLVDGAYRAGTVIPIQVTFNDKISVTGTPTLALNTNTSSNATYVSGSGTDTLTFGYTVKAGETAADLNYLSSSAISLGVGTITDSVGNAAIIDLPDPSSVDSLGYKKAIVIDTKIPTGAVTVSSGNPSNNTVNLNLTALTDNGSGLWQMQFSNDNQNWTAWEAYADSKLYVVSSGTSQKKIYVRWKDKADNNSSIFVVTINPPAVANSLGEIATNEDTTLSGQLLTLTNLDGRTISPVIMISNPSKGKVTVGTTPGSNPNKVIYTYVPNANVNGTDSFSFKVSDGISYSNTVIVNLLINPVNDPPVATNSSISVVEDTAISSSLIAVDEESASLTYSIVDQPANGIVAIQAASGAFTYTPDANFYGTDTFTFKVYDGAAYSNLATVILTVQPVNDVPIANSQSLSILEDANMMTGNVTGTDADSNTSLSYTLVSNGKKGNAILNSNGNGGFTYKPNANENGVDTFTFQASDGILNSQPATVTVTIAAVNDAPSFTKGLDQKASAVSIQQSINGWAKSISSGPADEAGQTVSFTVTNNTYAALFAQQPTISPSGTLTFTPEDNVDGTATITIKLVDDGGSSNGGINESVTQSFTIKIEDVSLNIASIVADPNNWTQGPVTVTVNAYSKTAIVSERYASGPFDSDYFSDTSNGTEFKSTGKFSVSENGIYTIYVDNGALHEIEKITINNIDKVKPVIQLREGPELTIEAGSSYTDPGAEVNDDSLPGGFKTIFSSSNVNANSIGDYLVHYDFMDEAGNPAVSVTRMVYVRDTTAPVIKLLGSNPLTVVEHTDYDDLQLGSSATDNSGEAIVVSRTGTLPDTAKPGMYLLTYTATDSSSNTVSITRSVYVLDNTPPTIDTVEIQPSIWTKGPITISALFTDPGSNIKYKKWAAGVQTADYFKQGSSSQVFTIADNSFEVTESNHYSIYSEDFSGNSSIYVVNVNNIDTSSPVGGMIINNGMAVTDSVFVTLQLSVNDTGSGVKEIRISNDPSFSDVNWQSYDPSDTIVWDLLPGDGTKIVYIQFKDKVGNESVTSSAAIFLDALGRANLAGLNSTISLNPLFNPTILNYTIQVEHSQTEVNLIPILVDNQSTISVTGATYLNGIIKVSNLANGSNPILIRVTNVTAATFKEYSVNIYKQSNLNDITGFVVIGQVTPTLIDSVHHTVTTSVYGQTSLNGLIPLITISPGASIAFSSNSTNDFTNVVYYDVISEDNTLQQWTVHITTLHSVSTDLSNLSIEGFPFPFENQTNSYSIDVGPLVTYVPITAVPADLTASISISDAGYEQKTVTQIVYLAYGINPIHVTVKDSNGLTQTYTLHVNRLPGYISNVSFTGGIASPSFNRTIKNYVIHTDPTAQTIDVSIPNLNPNVKVEVDGASYTFTGGLYHINITNATDFTIQVKNLEGTVVQERYHYSINPWLGFATSNAQGTEVIVAFKQAVDFTTFASSGFTLTDDAGHIMTIASIAYDASNVNHPTVHLKLNGTLAAQSAWLLNIDEVTNTAGDLIHVTSFPIFSSAHVLEIQQNIDLLNDGVHIDDIIKKLNAGQDLTGDNRFDSYDIQFLLQQI